MCQVSVQGVCVDSVVGEGAGNVYRLGVGAGSVCRWCASAGVGGVDCGG